MEGQPNGSAEEADYLVNINKGVWLNDLLSITR
jgi:hypothetical protein